MNRERAKYFEGELVRIATYDGYEVLDSYDYNEDTGELFLNANALTIYDDEIASIYRIKDVKFPKHIVRAYKTNINSNHIH